MTTTPTFDRIATKDLLSVAALDRQEIQTLMETAAAVKRDPRPYRLALADKTMVMLFEKPSLRTRVSFEAGFARLGGTAIYLDHQGSRLGERESIGDYARNLERWVDVLVARTFLHATIEELAAAASIPVINALSDLYHPCQALADAFSLWERFPEITRVKLAYVGDGGNVCHSLLLVAAKLGLRLTVITPAGYQPQPEVARLARELAEGSGAAIVITDDLDAVAGHNAVYTDTWVSMGHEGEAAERRVVLSKYQVNGDLMAKAAAGALFMHCLPAHRGDEVTAEVIDSPQSIVFDQAENRMHVQNAILLHMVAPPAGPPQPPAAAGTVWP